ncbi:MAG: hypothetical protein HKO62_11600 [Gammaproteobacteria bacterium]|nr:hypothetical protein [Gammaproteobacteria bacterium]
MPLFVTNPGFEADVVPGPTNINSGVPAGWSAHFDGPLAGAFFGSLYAAPDNYPAGAPEGNNVGVNFIAAGQASGVGFGLTQVLGAVIEPDTRYTLTVEVGNIDSGFNDLNNTPANPDDDPFFDIRGYNGYRIELRANDGGAGTLLVEDDNSSSIADGTFETRRIFFDSDSIDPALIGQQLEVRLVNLNLVDPLFSTSDRETNFDDVRVTATPVPAHQVPVPAWALVSLMVLVLIRARRSVRAG